MDGVIDELVRCAREYPYPVLILTPNRRLASLIQRTDQEHAMRQSTPDLLNQNAFQSQVQPVLEVMPWKQWLVSLVDQYELQQLNSTECSTDLLEGLLDPIQEQLLWIDIVKQSSIADQLLQVEQTVGVVQEASHLMTHYGISSEELQPLVDEDGEQFLQWRDTFIRRCEVDGLLPDSHCVDWLLARDLSDILNFKKVLFYGFRHLSPLEKRFIEALEVRYGIEIELTHAALDSGDYTPVARAGKVYASEDVGTEFQSAAHWAIGKLQAIAKQPNPEWPRIAIVVPELDRYRPMAQRVFKNIGWPKQALAPMNSAIDIEQFSRWVNVSGGQPLFEASLIQHAFYLLKSMLAPFRTDVLNRLLRSPFCGGAELEGHARQKLGSCLGELSVEEIDLLGLVSLSKKQCPTLAEIANKASAFQKRYVKGKGGLSLEIWAELFTQWLLLWGWPGQRALSSEEYQIHRKWLGCLSQYKQLLSHAEFDKEPTYRLGEALSVLQRVLLSTTYQAQSDFAPIQILGLLEADGQPFDYVWIMGLHSEVWPQPIKPNPFIPITLQRQYGLPRSIPENELMLARALLSDFALNTKKELVLSWPKNEGDRLLRCSPLLDNYEQYVATPSVHPSDHYGEVADALVETVGLVDIVEQYGPQLSLPQKAKGGTALIKDQGLCPFRAYVRHRLNVKETESMVMGVSAAERGEVMHRALQRCWETLHDQATLLQTSRETLTDLVRAALDEAVSHVLGEQVQHLSEQMVVLELKRLERLLLEWFEHESERESFKVIALESPREVSISGLSLQCRLDRVDELENGLQVIIDYKSGHAAIAQWSPESLLEPQLPLYAVDAGPSVGGIAFGQIRTSGAQLKALTSADLALMPKKSRAITVLDDWQSQLQAWSQTINARIDHFVQGWAVVEPLDKTLSCRYCPYGMACRVAEKA